MSLLRSLYPAIAKIPSVENPKGHVPFSERLKWTLVVLLLYFVLASIPIFGLAPERIDYFQQLRAVIAGRFGSVITLGIGPIVTASIIMQLLVGSKLVDLDLTNPEDRKVFEAWQKFLAIVFCFVEAIPWVILGGLPPADYNPFGFLGVLVILQLALGGIILLYLDEVVTKYGIGSGIGLFIVAGVASEIIVGSLNPLPSPANPEMPSGLLPSFIVELTRGNFNPYLLVPIFGTLLIFFLVVYMESVRVEIPISYGRFGSFGGRFPMKLLYTSNIPVILAAALLANINLWARALQGMGIPLLGTFVDNTPASGIVYYLNPPRRLFVDLLQGVITMDALLRALTYTAYMVIFSIIFSVFWVETAGMNPREIARQLQSSYFQIPGWRRDPRIIEKVLSRYIPKLAVLGGAIVGLLAALGDFTGALGGGMGVLLAVSITYNFYEIIASQRLIEMHPMLRKVLELE